MKSKDIAQEWFRVADMDLSSAQFLRQMHPPPIEVICYHCQQAAEKYLKGFLALHGEPVRKTHDLVALNNHCTGIDPAFQSIKTPCFYLTDYGVNIRYPFSFEVNEADAEKALENAHSVGVFVKKQAG